MPSFSLDIAIDFVYPKLGICFGDHVILAAIMSMPDVYAGARTALTRTFDRTLPDLEPHSAGVKPHLSGSLPERTSDRLAHMDTFIRICG